jgi:hypothetical protein
MRPALPCSYTAPCNGYDEIEALFTLMAERYEHSSMVITKSRLRSVGPHFQEPDDHRGRDRSTRPPSVILEFDGPSVRAEEAKRRNGKRDTCSASS